MSTTAESTATLATPAPSPRAAAIARGLLRSGRARAGSGASMARGNLLRLDRICGGYFLIPAAGDKLLRSDTFGDADEMQPGFVEAMARAGA